MEEYKGKTIEELSELLEDLQEQQEVLIDDLDDPDLKEAYDSNEAEIARIKSAMGTTVVSAKVEEDNTPQIERMNEQLDEMLGPKPTEFQRDEEIDTENLESSNFSDLQIDKSIFFGDGGKTKIGIMKKGGKISKELNLQGIITHSDNSSEILNLLKKYKIQINNSKPSGAKGYGVEYNHTNTDYYEYWFNTYDVKDVDGLFNELEEIIEDKDKDVDFLGYMGEVKNYNEAENYEKGGMAEFCSKCGGEGEVEIKNNFDDGRGDYVWEDCDECEYEKRERIESSSELYDTYFEKYPYATELVAYYIYDYKDDNDIYNMEIGKYGKPIDITPYSELMLDYENTWKDKMPELDEQVKELIDNESMETGMFAKGGVTEKDQQSIIQEGTEIEYVDEDGDYAAIIGYKEFFGRNMYYIWFNGKMVHSSITYKSMLRKLNQLKEDYKLEYGGAKYAKGGFLSRLFGGKPKKSETSKKLRRYNHTYIISDKKGKPIIKGDSSSPATSRKEAHDKLKKSLQENIDSGYYEDGDKIEIFTPKQYKESKYFKKGYAKGGEVITDSFGDKYELREDEEININDYVYFGDTGDISVVEDEEDLEFARAGKTKAVPYAKGGFIKDNYWGIDEDEFNELKEEKQLDLGKWYLYYNDNMNEWEATMDGNYTHTFKSLDDLMERKNEIDVFEYNEKLSEEKGEEVITNSKGEIRKYAKGGKVEEYVVIKGNKTKTFDNKKSAKEYKNKIGGEYAEIIDGRLLVYKDQYIYAKGGEIKVGDKVMALMRGTNGYQNVIIESIDKKDGILRNTDNPETLLSVYSEEEKLSDEIFAREIKGFAKGGMVDYDEVKEEVLDKYGYTIQDFNKGDMNRHEAQKIMKETNEVYMKRAKPQYKDLGMRKFAKGGSTSTYFGGGNYLEIFSEGDKLIVKPTEDGLGELRDGNDVINLFEDISSNSEITWHDDLGMMGFGLTEASGLTDGFYYEDDGSFTNKGNEQGSGVYYFNDYMLRSPEDDLMNRGELVLFRQKRVGEYAKGGEIRRSPIRKLAFEMYNKEFNELSSKEQKKVEDKRDELMDKDYNSYKKKYFAKGGETASPITNYRKNIMGTLSFDLKVKGMRKPQDFIVYPITEKTDKIRIQSDKKWGEIHINSGKGILSKSGSTSWHLHSDMMNMNVIKFELTPEELEELKTQIKSTSGKDVGNTIMRTDNSGAALLEHGGEIDLNDVSIYEADENGNFTVVIDGDVFDMNYHTMPNMSINMYAGSRSEYPSDISHWGKKITFEDAPQVIKDKIGKRIEEFHTHLDKGGKIKEDKRKWSHHMWFTNEKPGETYYYEDAVIDYLIDNPRTFKLDINRRALNKPGKLSEVYKDMGISTSSGYLNPQDIKQFAIDNDKYEWLKIEGDRGSDSRKRTIKKYLDRRKKYAEYAEGLSREELLEQIEMLNTMAWEEKDDEMRSEMLAEVNKMRTQL